MREATVTHRLSNPGALFQLVEAKYQNDVLLADLRSSFNLCGYVALPHLFCPESFDLLREEVQNLQIHAAKRDFTMPGYETPRRLQTVGAQVICSVSPLLFSTYLHFDIKMLVREITGGPVFACQHPQEFMVANFLEGKQATHGWHLDDPPFALVLFFDAPSQAEGGCLEFIPEWHSFCARHHVDAYKQVAGAVEVARTEGLVQIRHHATRDAYLLRADKCLHRVPELQSITARRAVLNLAFQNEREMLYGETANLLYR